MNSRIPLFGAAGLLGWFISVGQAQTPEILAQPTNVVVLAGGAAAFSVAASGAGPLTYQWQFNGTNLPYYGVITTVAGNGTHGYSGDDGPANGAELGYPGGVAVDASGNLFIADADDNVIRKVGTNGIITTVAGNGTIGYSGDGGPATSAQLCFPRGVAVGASGNLFIADAGSNVVREVRTDGIISTVASRGIGGYSGDGGAATNAQLKGTVGVAVDAAGNLFIADEDNNVIRKVGTNGIITTAAGNGTNGYSGDGGPATNAELRLPGAVAVDVAGNLFIADSGNNRIREVGTNGIIATVAGNGTYGYSGDGGPATNAELDYPSGVAIGASGNLFIADGFKNVVREVGTNGIITTVAGSGSPGYSGDGGPATNADLFGVQGVAVDAAGNLFIADAFNRRIREVAFPGPGPVLALANVGSANAGAYDVVVSNPYGSVTSSVATLLVAFPPAIVTQPQSQGVAIGSNATLSVAATGTARLDYQWFLGSAPLQGQTNTTLRLSAAGFTNAGAYNVVVTNPYGSVTSAAAVLSVGVAPGITEQPVSQAALAGNNVTLAVAVAGTGPLTYQWQLNGVNLPYDVVITTVAGNGTNGYSGDGGPATNAELNYPAGVAVDAAGNLFIGDQLNMRIRRVGTNGIITTVAGNGAAGYSGDSGPAASAELGYPSGVAVDAAGNLFIADSANIVIREVGTNGIITTVAGEGIQGYSGDGGPATSAELYYPNGVAVDASGNLFIADQDGNVIREVGTDGIITTVAGNGFGAGMSRGVGGYSGDGGAATKAELDWPACVAVDASGNLFIADAGNNVIREVGTNGIITTVAGNGFGAGIVGGVGGYSGDGGAATKAELYWPNGVAVDAFGNLFIADASNNGIRKVGTDGIITTVAGNGTRGYTGDGGPATNAELSYPTGVAVDASGNLFIADSSNNRIRKLVFPGPRLLLANVVGTNAGSYDVVVSSPYGSVTSSVVTLQVVFPPAIVTQPQSRWVAIGSNAALGVAATGTAPLEYQWYWEGAPLQGQTNATLLLSAGGLTNALSYNVVVTNLYGSVTSTVAVVTVGLPPAITEQPVSQTALAGSNVTLEVAVAGTGPFTYQWQLNGVNLANEANSPTLNLARVSAANAGDYQVIITSPYARVTSALATVTVLFPPAIVTQPANLAVGVGGTATFSVTATGTQPLSYSWYFNGANLVQSGSNPSLSLTNVILSEVGGYTVVITNLFGSVTSAVANLSVAYPPTIASEPASQAAFFGSNVTLKVVAAGAGPFTYRWQFNGVELANDLISTVAGGGVADGEGGTNAIVYTPSGVAVDASGNLFIVDSGNNRIRKMGAGGIITTVAGNGLPGYSGDGRAAVSAGLNSPGGVAVDASGNLFIADTGNEVIRKVDTHGIITTVAGNGKLTFTPQGIKVNPKGGSPKGGPGGNYSGTYSGDGGAATNAGLNLPSGVAVDAAGNLFIADQDNGRIRKVDANAIITTVAGNGTGGYSGDGGAATNASLSPSGVGVDAAGRLFIADSANNRIREVASNGIITTLAGNGTWAYSGDGGAATNASLNNPSGVGLEASGDLLIADSGNNRIRKVDTNGIITTVAGNGPSGLQGGFSGDGGPATNASLNNPVGVAVGASGNLFIADQANERIRNVDVNGIITTVAGNGSIGYCGDGGAATNASLSGPAGSAADASGNLFIADGGNQRVRKVDLNGIISTVAGNGSAGYSGDGGAATIASLNGPSGAAVDASGNLFIADEANDRIRKVGVNGVVTTVAGGGDGDGGAATDASLNNPTGAAVDASGNLFIADFSKQRVRKVDVNGIITTVAGNGVGGYSGDGGAATDASLSGPSGVAVDASGNLFIADQYNNRIRKVDANGIISTVAGGGSGGGYSGDGGAATNASLSTPYGVAVDASSNLFITDSSHQRVRKVGVNGIITTVAGNGVQGYSGDSGAATNASLGWPSGVAVDALGNLFIADLNNQRIRKVDANGVISTVAGNGFVGGPGGYRDGGAATDAYLYYPSGVAVDASGNLFIADQDNQRIRKVDADGIITTVAGSGFSGFQGSFSGDGGAATIARLNDPAGVAVDASGSLFIADSGNNRIRKVDVNGIIATVAGNGSSGYSGDGGAATDASLNAPSSVVVDASANLFIADSGNNRIRKVDVNGIIATVAGTGSSGWSGDSGAATNASLNDPSAVALDASGNLFLVDYGNNRIRKVDVNGIITTVAGNGSSGYSGDGEAATNASLEVPSGVAVDASGNLFIADQHNQRIRKVDVNGIITTVAGNPRFSYGYYGGLSWLGAYSGDGGAATNAGLNLPSGVAVDASGNLFIADSGNNRIREVPFGGHPTLTLSDVSAASGGEYQVIITSPYGSVTSAVATLTVLAAPPFIVRQPGNVAAAVGSTATLSVDALGAQPRSCSWYFNGANLVQTGTNSTLSLANVNLTQAGAYTVVVTNLFGSVTSAVATLSVGYPPIITGQPASQAALDGSNVTLKVAVAGTAPFTYQWQVNGVSFPRDLIATVAGGGSGGDGGAATKASLGRPAGVAADALGNVFIADTVNNRIRKVDTSGVITTVAGNGSIGYSGDGGPATNASLGGTSGLPCGVAVDASGNLFIADTLNAVIRKVDTNGIITTVAGGGSGGHSGNGGAAANASLNNPCGVAVDAAGNLFIADLSARVQRVDAGGIITTVAGNGTEGYTGDGGPATNATLGGAFAVAVDAFGNLFIADLTDSGSVRVRKVDVHGIITTVAGNGRFSYSGDGGPATDASLWDPQGLAVDASGNLFIADMLNNRIRKVNLQGIISTVAGDGSSGYSGDGGAATDASLSRPVAVAVDASGNLFIADQNNQRVRKVNVNGIITTVAGNGFYRYFGEGGAAANASLNDPFGVAADASGRLFIADSGNNRIRELDSNGIVTTVAGNGSSGYSGDGGAATNASLNEPTGVAVDASGNLFIADQSNQCIRQVDANGIISTVAGGGSGGGYSGDGGAATNASLNGPYGVAVDASGNLLITDSSNQRVRKVNVNGIITTVAGNGLGGYSGDGGAATNASLNNPYGLAVDALGDLFIADSGNDRIRKVDTNGIITTVAGKGNDEPFGVFSGDGGAATNASLNGPYGVAVDVSGNLFIVDQSNQRIRKVDSDGMITTVAGNGSSGYSGDGGAATNASLNSPSGIGLDAYGNLLIADSANNRIRAVALAGLPTLTLSGVSAANDGAYQVVITSPYGSVTSAVAAVTVALAPLDAALNAAGAALLTFRGTPGTAYVLQAAFGLTPPIDWQPVFTNAADANGIWSFSDTNALNSPTHFYRLKLP